MLLCCQGLELAECFTLLQASNHMPRLERPSVSAETPVSLQVVRGGSVMDEAGSLACLSGLGFRI